MAKSWEEVVASPEYQKATPQQQANAKAAYDAKYGKGTPAAPKQEATAPAPTSAEPKKDDWASSVGDFLSSAGQAGVESFGRGIQRAGHGLQEITAPLVNTLTGSQAYTQSDVSGLQEAEKADKTSYSKRMDSLSSQAGRTVGETLGGTTAGLLEFSNPLIAGIAETGGAYADQAPEDKSLLRAGTVGLTGAATAKFIPKVGGTGLSGIAKQVGTGAGVGAAGSAAMGMASEYSRTGGRATGGEIIAEGLREAPTGAAFGATFSGLHAGINAIRGRAEITTGTPRAEAEETAPVAENIATQAEKVNTATTGSEARQAFEDAPHLRQYNALNALEQNGFRVNDAAVRDNPAGQEILGTSQKKAESSFTGAEGSNYAPLVGGKSARAGKFNADLEHNQRLGKDFVKTNHDNLNDNINALQSHLDDIHQQMEDARVAGDFAGSEADIRAVTKNDSDLLNAYKDWAKDARTMDARGEGDMNAFLNKSERLQDLYAGASDEAKSIVDNFSKNKGMPEGFNPIQDAHALNDIAAALEKQDRGWKTVTAEGLKTKETPLKNPLNIQEWGKWGFGKLRASTRINARAAQQAENASSIRNLAASDLAVTRSRRSVEEAKAAMEVPANDPIPFKEEPVAQPEPAQPTGPSPEDIRANNQLARSEAMIRARQAAEARRQQETAAQAQPEPVVEAPTGPTEADIAANTRLAQSEAQIRQRVSQGVTEPAPEVPAQPTGPSQAELTAGARNEAAVARHKAELDLARRHAEEQAAAEQTPEPAPEVEPQPAPQPDQTLIREPIRPKAEPVVEPEPAQEAPAPKAEPLPAKAPEKQPKVAKEDAVPEAPKSEANRILAEKKPQVRQAMQSKLDRFKRVLSSPVVKAKATLENIYGSKLAPKEFLRRLVAEDNAVNVERHNEMAKRAVENQEQAASAKNIFVRERFADWVKERGMPDEFAQKALRAEEKGRDGNVSSVEALKRRAERLYQKKVDDDFNKMYEDALKEDRNLFPGEQGPTLEAQKADFTKEMNSLLKEEVMSPEQKAAVKQIMEEHINDAFKGYEKGGRTEGLETGQSTDLWNKFYNEYRRQAGTFLKANKEGQYKMAADAIADREQRLTEALTKRKAQLAAREQKAKDIESVKAIDAQRSQMEKLLNSLPEDIRESNTKLTMRQMASHHNQGSPVPPERFRYMIERIGNNEHTYLERQARISQKEKEALQEKMDRMRDQANELNRKFDVAKRAKESAEEQAKLQKANDAIQLTSQRDDIHTRVHAALKEHGIEGELAEKLAGSYMDTNYGVLEKPMSPTEYQNARSRVERDMERYAKKYGEASTGEKMKMETVGEGDKGVYGEDVAKTVDEAANLDKEVDAMRQEQQDLEKARDSLNPEERSELSEAQKKVQEKAEEDFLDKVETTFKNSRNLDQLLQVASILDRVQGKSSGGNNRRFISALKTAAENKKLYGDNPIVWFTSEDYSSIAKLGSGSAGGNKTRALEKIFGTTAEEAKRKLFGVEHTNHMRNILEKNKGIKLPDFHRSTKEDYHKFMDKYNIDGTPKSRGALAKPGETMRKASARIRVRPKKVE